MEAARGLSESVGTVQACNALCLPRSSYYRHFSMKEPVDSCAAAREASPRALSPDERETVLETLCSPRFVDKSPAQVFAALLDEDDKYLCSIRTMYRILKENGEVMERRNQLRHPNYSKPELLATRPNEVWSWDITKLKGPVKWTYYYLYVILDIFSRYVVGWMVAHRESAELAKRLILETCRNQGIERDTLTIHADRGSSMKSKSVAFLLSDLGITKTHSRPHVSNDNPYSESHFKTMKYQPLFPERFGSMEDSRAFCCEFFPFYNNEHYHSGIGLMTPASVHYGFAEEIREKRQRTLKAAYEKHPERFVRKMPEPPVIPGKVWINPPVTGNDRKDA
jgi:putative transposase